MLTQDIKRKIDNARQILVGKVPDPKAQVEQITLALIYKFMDDMDKQAMSLPKGRAQFFTNGYEQYAWNKLMDPRLGGQERLDLYVRAITELGKNPHLPQLFRDIYKNAFLPFRDSATLNLFLKEINIFEYDHSENLGDAFEYLLSILGSQGEAGQFRTPRHIIDFIVSVVDPKKDETVLDPACGTAGFLISAYKHILEAHDGIDDPERKEKPLTPDERKKLMNNFAGYDISPDMVKLSLVNMYLHGFPHPSINEYDTLTSEDRWDERFDVILANPPFMSPKGGIRPHKRFSVQANRSEVLFVDYIKEHLNPKGRAGIIVPEGIIFQSAGAYKQLRRLLVEDGLYAVVSLPGGVFNPYSGVKTSILFFDNELAKKTKEILFIKIANDGFDLGAQRREIEDNDLPEAINTIRAFQKYVKGEDESDNLYVASYAKDKKQKTEGELWSCFKGNVTFVSKKFIAENGDYSLSGERYKESGATEHKQWPMVELGEVCEINPKKSQLSELSAKTEVSFVPMSDLSENSAHFDVKQIKELGEVSGGYTYFADNDVLLAKVTPCFENGKAGIAKELKNSIGFGSSEFIVLRVSEKILPEYVYRFISSDDFRKVGKSQMFGTGGLQRISTGFVKKYKIPLPPIEVQKEIVEQIEVKQNAINAAREVIKNLEKERQHFGQGLRKLEGVESVELGEIGKISMCKRIFKDQTTTKGDVPFYKIGTFGQQPDAYISQKVYSDYISKYPHPKKGDVLISTSGTIGKTVVHDGRPAYFQDSNIVWIDNDEKLVLNEYLYYALQSIQWMTAKGVTIERLYNKLIEKTKISVPSLEVQKQMVEEADKEEQIITANRQLIELMENKITDVLKNI